MTRARASLRIASHRPWARRRQPPSACEGGWRPPRALSIRLPVARARPSTLDGRGPWMTPPMTGGARFEAATAVPNSVRCRKVAALAPLLPQRTAPELRWTRADDTPRAVDNTGPKPARFLPLRRNRAREGPHPRPDGRNRLRAGGAQPARPDRWSSDADMNAVWTELGHSDVDLGDQPPLVTADNRSGPPDRRRVSLRWLAGTVLAAMASTSLMGGALYVALDGRPSIAMPVDSLAPAASGAAAADVGGRCRLQGRHARRVRCRRGDPPGAQGLDHHPRRRRRPHQAEAFRADQRPARLALVGRRRRDPAVQSAAHLRRRQSGGRWRRGPALRRRSRRTDDGQGDRVPGRRSLDAAGDAARHHGDRGDGARERALPRRRHRPGRLAALRRFPALRVRLRRKQRFRPVRRPDHSGERVLRGDDGALGYRHHGRLYREEVGDGRQERQPAIDPDGQRGDRRGSRRHRPQDEAGLRAAPPRAGRPGDRGTGGRRRRNGTLPADPRFRLSRRPAHRHRRPLRPSGLCRGGRTAAGGRRTLRRRRRRRTAMPTSRGRASTKASTRRRSPTACPANSSTKWSASSRSTSTSIRASRPATRWRWSIRWTRTRANRPT